MVLTSQVFDDQGSKSKGLWIFAEHVTSCKKGAPKNIGYSTVMSSSRNESSQPLRPFYFVLQTSRTPTVFANPAFQTFSVIEVLNCLPFAGRSPIVIIVQVRGRVNVTHIPCTHVCHKHARFGRHAVVLARRHVACLNTGHVARQTAFLYNIPLLTEALSTCRDVRVASATQSALLIPVETRA